jgi:anaerobic selenocysteine-containing dehydrogenase
MAPVSVAGPVRTADKGRRLIGTPHEVRDDGTRIHLATCPLCECMCGIELHVNPEAEVTLIRPNRDDVWSKGFICPKGTALRHLDDDPDRIRVPMIRDGDTFRTASWDEAFDKCRALIHGVRQRAGGNNSTMTAFIGNPAGHSLTLGRYGVMLMGQAKFDSIYSAGTIDQWPKNVSSVLMYGNMWKIPAPDIPRTDYLVIMGGNPQASGGSLVACPDVLGEMDAIHARGGKVVVIDPRRTGTADKAAEWLPIRPGTDAAFLLALCHVFFDEGLVTLGHLGDLVDGVEVVAELVREFTPESVETWCQIPAETIRRIAHEYAASPRAALYGRIGLCNQEFGTLASWLVDVVNIVTGHFDTEGGLMWANPVGVPLAWLNDTKRSGLPQFGRWHSRVRGAPEVLGQVPCSCLAEEIATPGEGQIKGLFTIAANPVLSVPDSAKLEAALPELDFMISIDNYLNETTQFADVILPGPSPFESAHFDDIMWGWAMRSATKWSEQLYDLPEGQPAEWEILSRLGWYCTGGDDESFDLATLDDNWFRSLCRMYGVDAAKVMPMYEHGGPERMCDLAVRVGPWGDRYGENPGGITLDTIKAAPDGLDFGPMISRAAEMIGTPSGHIDLAPEYIVGDIPRLRERMATNPDGLVLVSRRHIRSKNSWMHNVKVLVKGKDRCTLLIHPDDATAAGVVDGAIARVSSEAGAIDVPVEVSDEMMRGVVSLPHGWGHDKPGARLSVAREHAGVNNNLLAPGHFVDVLSGNAAVNGIPVEVVLA